MIDAKRFEEFISSRVLSQSPNQELQQICIDGKIIRDSRGFGAINRRDDCAPCGWRATRNKQTLQDYRDFGAVHGSGTKYANMLMPDGSVKTFTDRNKDNFLNNGFDPNLFTGTGSIGYTTSDIEIPNDEMHSGYTLQNSFKGNLNTQ